MCLPQPIVSDDNRGIQYQYLVGEDIERFFFPQLPNFNFNQLVWVCKSKGRKKSSTHKKIQVIESNDSHTSPHFTSFAESLAANRSHQRHDLFSRAMILDPTIISGIEKSTAETSSKNNKPFWKDKRVMVQYPAGSTYHVNVNHIIPILHPTSDDHGHNHVVIVWPETDVYRRCCMIHCVPGYDSFIEIGCDEGELIYKMSQSLNTTEISLKNDSNRIDNVDNTFVLGLDKSKQSIDIARQRYPHCSFHVCDVLVDEPICWPIPQDLYCSSIADRSRQRRQRIVVAIDINGNREIKAVLQCLQIVMDSLQPRLIIVKSRSLYHQLKTDPCIRQAHEKC